MKLNSIHNVTTNNPIEYIKESAESLKESASYMKELLQNFQDFGNFFKELFNNPVGMLYKGLESLSEGFQSWGPDLMLITLLILVVMYFLGFKKSKKWICFVLVLGLLLVTF